MGILMADRRNVFYYCAVLTAGRSSEEKAVSLSVRASVCLSVCLSLKHVICDKTKENCARILTPHERSFSLEEWLVEATPYT